MTTDAQNKELNDFILAHSKSKSSTATYKSRYRRIVRNLPTRITDTCDKILIDIHVFQRIWIIQRKHVVD